MVPMILHAGQQKRHRHMEQTFVLSGRRWGWDGLRALNMCIITCEREDQCKFDAWVRVPKASALGHPRGIGWRGRWEEGAGWGGGAHVYLWLIHVDVWQKPSQYYNYPPIKINNIFLKWILCLPHPAHHVMVPPYAIIWGRNLFQLQNIPVTYWYW